jgi:murein L,D-transpeptidase YafK
MEGVIMNNAIILVGVVFLLAGCNKKTEYEAEKNKKFKTSRKKSRKKNKPVSLKPMGMVLKIQNNDSKQKSKLLKINSGVRKAFIESESCRKPMKFPAVGCLKLIKPKDLNVKVNYIFIEKTNRRMTLFVKKRVVARYKVALSRKWRKPKRRAGDIKTPVGTYYTSGKNKGSMFHRSIGVSYPNKWDILRAKRGGFRTGAAIEIHGIGPGADDVKDIAQMGDWTWGCISVTNKEIEEVFTMVPEGITIKIIL